MFFDKYIIHAGKINYHTNVYVICRSLLAFSLFITFLLNSNDTLFYAKNATVTTFYDIGLSKYGLFSLLKSNLFAAKFFALIILAFTISGYYPQITGILHWWVTFSFSSYTSTPDGGDQIASVLTLLLIPICILDPKNNAWKQQQKPKYRPVVSYILYYSYLIFRIQIAVIYFHAAIAKFNIEEWTNGTIFMVLV